ncbi:predicted protein [Postia placenta Mad-698-R]|uniref:Uncharacterized protein n=1 Tax=Postia placenta MAD-698-R-SB12 TaxID=670580 RepID=A0A1X6N2D2_9APHY|nr:hypothetical protein POSPLADRAFT_1140644 [Postia placenta MAD-698-R-SB12]EED81835.1 predicted protein [Postia placenta Mad-698-R]OSX62781.1 hypothetical protein POSPLADRAFT_1140644 [Postia placenta MAD-698-R-SB12]
MDERFEHISRPTADDLYDGSYAYAYSSAFQGDQGPVNPSALHSIQFPVQGREQDRHTDTVNVVPPEFRNEIATLLLRIILKSTQDPALISASLTHFVDPDVRIVITTEYTPRYNPGHPVMNDTAISPPAVIDNSPSFDAVVHDLMGLDLDDMQDVPPHAGFGDADPFPMYVSEDHAFAQQQAHQAEYAPYATPSYSYDVNAYHTDTIPFNPTTPSPTLNSVDVGTPGEGHEKCQWAGCGKDLPSFTRKDIKTHLEAIHLCGAGEGLPNSKVRYGAVLEVFREAVPSRRSHKAHANGTPRCLS